MHLAIAEAPKHIETTLALLELQEDDYFVRQHPADELDFVAG